MIYKISVVIHSLKKKKKANYWAPLLHAWHVQNTALDPREGYRAK